MTANNPPFGFMCAPTRGAMGRGGGKGRGFAGAFLTGAGRGFRLLLAALLLSCIVLVPPAAAFTPSESHWHDCEEGGLFFGNDEYCSRLEERIKKEIEARDARDAQDALLKRLKNERWAREARERAIKHKAWARESRIRKAQEATVWICSVIFFSWLAWFIFARRKIIADGAGKWFIRRRTRREAWRAELERQVREEEKQ